MQELETTVTEKGQVTIPRSVRARLGIKPKDKVAFEVEGDAVRIRRAPSRVLAGYGAVKPRRKPEDLRALREEFESNVAEEVIEETRH
jgi:AbrB family looped-hinge helix DNA binding protein